MDVEAVQRAESSIDKFIEDRTKGRAKANAEAALERAEDLRKAETLREENKTLWIHHYRKLAGSNLKAARDYRRRARKIEQGEA